MKKQIQLVMAMNAVKKPSANNEHSLVVNPIRHFEALTECRKNPFITGLRLRCWRIFYPQKQVKEKSCNFIQSTYLFMVHLAKVKNIIISFVLVVLLIGGGIVVSHLKIIPQIFVVLFTFLTLISFYFKNKIISNTVFYIFLGVLFYVSYFSLTSWIINLIDTNYGWVDMNGQKQKVMNMVWLLGSGISFIFSPLSVYFYHKRGKRNKQIEIIAISLFLISILFYLFFV